MVKHTKTICRLLLPTNCLGVFDHFVGLALKRLSIVKSGVFTPTRLLAHSFNLHFSRPGINSSSDRPNHEKFLLTVAELIKKKHP